MTDRKFKGLAGFRILAVFLLVAGILSCKSTEPAQTNSSTSDTTELEALYWSRVDSSRMSFTDADVQFMTMMIPHHAQALIMSDLAPENEANAEVRRLAARIINAQKDEISTMQQWLRDRDQPVPEIKIDGLDLYVELAGEPLTSYQNMHGVLSEEQIQELANARGSDFDRLFLSYMIEHHSGAVHMVENLFSKDGAAQGTETFRLASDIQVDQITEIERMSMMLNELSDPG